MCNHIHYYYRECGHWWSDGWEKCAEKQALEGDEQCDRSTCGIRRDRQTRPGCCERCYYPSLSDQGRTRTDRGWLDADVAVVKCSPSSLSRGLAMNRIYFMKPDIIRKAGRTGSVPEYKVQE
jgi:hypothetical protein